jgi:hypothetical protein
MKVEIKEKEVKTSIEYPYLGIYEDKSFIVFFISEKTGYVLWRNLYGRNVGDFSSVWVENNFTPFNGTITLSND